MCWSARLPASVVDAGETGGTFGTLLLGIGLGTLYVPCAGPVLAAISIAGATAEIGWRTVVLTISFALGAAILLAFSLRWPVRRWPNVSRRTASGSGRSASAAVPCWWRWRWRSPWAPGDAAARDSWLHRRGRGAIARQQAIIDAARPVSGTGEIRSCIGDATRLAHCGAAPEFSGAGRWFNTDGRPLTIAGLRGKVVLVDFWTYSCINCLRAMRRT